MNSLIHPIEKSGLLCIRNGIRSEEKALAIKAALEDLPGVYAAEMRWDGVRMRFDPDLVSEQQFYDAVTVSGFCASNFTMLGDN